MSMNNGKSGLVWWLTAAHCRVDETVINACVIFSLISAFIPSDHSAVCCHSISQANYTKIKLLQ